MERSIGDHVPAVAAVLSAVSLSLVLGTAGGFVPGSALPRSDPVLNAVPHLNAAVSLVAIGVIAGGVRAIRAGNVSRHRRAMLAGLGLFATFLVGYLYRVAVLGPTHFDGPAWVESFVYLPVLAVHILLAIVCVPLLYYVALLGLTTPVAHMSETSHPRLGRVTAALWVTSFALGVVVYGLLYWL
jgi:putative membrane protein